ncbi:oligosaccharide flippase family protein [Aquimarina sp. D1M17]|uniref:oligosaccharide flippase family protein n=1 Tax=Aquimarina acroporae TaxID=2937283 RepID=UPI0020C08771|nr:oligosaccharide flippase family protein [Aquimarina acroporae]MCK8521336.1 oligosaccharide flippase family protein [Aquimarina acroporae]
MKALKNITAEQKFMLSVIIVNGGNYLYNLLLGRILGPQQFADAALLITFLLVLSFIAMTFQLSTAKFSVLFENSIFKNFINIIYKYATLTGIVFGILIVAFSNQLQTLFNTQTSLMFILFGIGVPLYFIMSVNRGFFQGSKKFEKLAITYQGEMISRLLITLLLIYTINLQSSILVSLGIALSFMFGLIPFHAKDINPIKKYTLPSAENKYILRFFTLTAFYELSQIIINNSDILLVKHYFETYDAGLYASLALIGRVVYFVAWMFVMLLLPKVVQLQKEGVSTAPILFKYVFYITLLSSSIVIGCYFFPELVINIMFGKQYISIAPLLWKYAIATSLFAISNIFAYYFLSLDQYIPVIISSLLGILQVVLIILFHNSLLQVVIMQIVAMTILLVFQLLFFVGYQKISSKNLTKG